MKRIQAFLAATAISAVALQGQTYFSVNAGTDGFNFNITNAPPLFPAVVVAPVAPVGPVCVPLRPGVEYRHVSPKRYKKAVKRYRKAMRHGHIPVMGVSLPGGVIVGTSPGYYYDDDDDDDDWEDWLEDRYEHHHKHKHHKKHHKDHHKHHHKHH